MAKKNKTYSFSVLGQTLNIGMTKEDIENKVNTLWGKKGSKLVYNLISSNEVEIIIERNFKYSLQGDVIADMDMSALAGIGMHCFVPEIYGGKPLIFPLMPFGHEYYSPIEQFKIFYKDIVKIKNDSEVKDIEIVPKSDKLIMRLKF